MVFYRMKNMAKVSRRGGELVWRQAPICQDAAPVMIIICSSPFSVHVGVQQRIGAAGRVLQYEDTARGFVGTEPLRDALFTPSHPGRTNLVVAPIQFSNKSAAERESAFQW